MINNKILAEHLWAISCLFQTCGSKKFDVSVPQQPEFTAVAACLMEASQTVGGETRGDRVKENQLGGRAYE